IYSAQNMIEEAIQAFKTAIEMDPEYSLPHTNLGSLYGTVGRVESAIKEFKKATSLNPGDAQAWLNLNQSYKEIGRVEDATKAFQQYEMLTKEAPPAGGTADGSGIPGGVSTTGDTAN
ncbi:MAG: tetratricopeptide repeat protein, partial [Nitrospinae bacterium]|nr:tetratricopeptide repeat protein [Nitrospinota bacterium]